MASVADLKKEAKKEEKKEAKTEKSEISKQVGKLAKNIATGFLVFLMMVFILGEAYAYYALKSGSALLLWLPVLVLVAVLFVKAVE